MSATLEQNMPQEEQDRLDKNLEALEAEFAPDLCNTLGALAVDFDLIRAVSLTQAESWLDSEFPNGNTIVEEELQETRDRLEGIAPESRAELEIKVLSYPMPQFLHNAMGDEHVYRIFDRLVEKQPDGSYVVSDDTLLNVLQWHSFQMTTDRKEFMERDWQHIKGWYAYRLKQAVSDGWLPDDVLAPDRLKALDQVDVTVDDGVHLYESGCAAYVCRTEIPSVAEVYLPRSAPTSLAHHELSHVMVGVKVPKNSSKGRFSEGRTTQGMIRLFDKKYVNAGIVIDEAVTEHIAQTLGFSGDPELISPSVKKEVIGFYYAERELLNALCNSGIKPVDIRLFTKAYFEDSSRYRQPAIRELKRELKKAFPGHDVLDELGELMLGDDHNKTNIEQFTLRLKLGMAKYKNDMIRTEHDRKTERLQKKIAKIQRKLT